jgi:hypothetical protein
MIEQTCDVLPSLAKTSLGGLSVPKAAVGDIITNEGIIGPSQSAMFNGDHTKISTSALRQEMRERLYKLLQTHCINKNDTKGTAAATAIEAHLFRSVEGRSERYAELLQDQEALSSNLKQVGTRILLRSLRKKQANLGFRSRMVLTGIVAGTKAKDVERRVPPSKTGAASEAMGKSRKVQENDDGMDCDDYASASKNGESAAVDPALHR